jgi:hypothetical protein
MLASNPLALGIERSAKVRRSSTTTSRFSGLLHHLKYYATPGKPFAKARSQTHEQMKRENGKSIDIHKSILATFSFLTRVAIEPEGTQSTSFGHVVKCEVAPNKRSAIVGFTTSNAARCCLKRFKHGYVTVQWAFKPSITPNYLATTPPTGGDSASENVEATENSVQAEGLVPGKSPTPHYTRIESYSEDDGLLLRLQVRRK